MIRVLLIAMSVFLGLTSQAQYKKDKGAKTYERFKLKAKYHEGFVTLRDSSQMRGVIKRLTSYLADGDIKLISIDGEKESFYAKEVFGYESGGDKYVTFEGTFYKVEIEDLKMSLYSRIGTNVHSMPAGPNGGMTTYTNSYTMYFVMKSDEIFPTSVPSKKRKFKKFAPYFSDCQTVQSAVESGSLNSDGISTVVRKYNKCWE